MPFRYFLDRFLRQKRVAARALTILTQRQQKYCTWAGMYVKRGKGKRKRHSLLPPSLQLIFISFSRRNRTSDSLSKRAGFTLRYTRRTTAPTLGKNLLFLKTFSRFATRRINDVTKQKMRAFFRVNDLETKSVRDSWDLGSSLAR
ncbi:hypothetical protein CDAR_303931 [Caerostris darwini]|uniref:Uncharacterized protein n=1 Tax=Caerostris darwini TaxID=1538125 RepID=A0AAV4T960_9ARAC|nr:hypothetical protein CDAR_303931 [Caerostris darwini]